MAKRKRKEQESVEDKGDAYEPPAAQAGTDSLSDWPPTPEEPAQPKDDARAESPGPQRPPRAAPKPRSVLSRALPGRKVEMIDDGNAAGLGIQLSFDDPAERPSETVKQILKEGDDQRPGFGYRGDLKQWRKRIGADADPRTAVAIRLDAERRVEAIGDQMSHEEKLKAEREQSGDRGPGTPS